MHPKSNRKMMTHFRGYYNYNDIVKNMYFRIFFSVLLIGVTAMAKNDHEINKELAEMAGYGENKLSTVLITGTLLGDYSLGEIQATPTPVSGAEVGVSCQTSEKISKLSWAKSTTDEYGDFVIDLPSHLHAIPNLDKICAVTVLRLPDNYYSLSHNPTGDSRKHAMGLTLSSVDNDIRTYTAQILYLKPETPQE